MPNYPPPLPPSPSPLQVSGVRTLPAAVIACALAALALAGCSGFFIKPTATTTTTTTTATTTAYAYVANPTTSTIAGFNLGAGTLVAVPGSPYATAVAPSSVAVTPANTFLYAGSPLGAIFGYSIATATGQLTPLSSGAVLANSAAEAMDISPDGNWLFILDASGVTIDLYAINPTTGALTPSTGATITLTGTPILPRAIRISPNGDFVAATMGTGGTAILTFNTATGALAQTSSINISATASDNGLVFTASSTVLYVARSGTGGGILAFSVAADSTLASLTGSPFTAGTDPYAPVIDSTGAFLYVANRTDATIDGFAIGTTGTLTTLASSPFATGTLPTALGRDSTGKYILAAAAGGSPDLTLYTLDAASPGKLDQAATATTGTDPTGATAIALTH